jgi:hypothetical protein
MERAVDDAEFHGEFLTAKPPTHKAQFSFMSLSTGRPVRGSDEKSFRRGGEDTGLDP